MQDKCALHLKYGFVSQTTEILIEYLRSEYMYTRHVYETIKDRVRVLSKYILPSC